MTFDDAIRTVRDRLQLPEWAERGLTDPAARISRQVALVTRALEREIPDMADVQPITLQGPGGPIRARLYVPMGAGLSAGPGLVFFHGGGFMVGDLESHDVLCRRLAEASRCRLIAIDYRLAPAHAFPAAHEDARAAWNAIAADAARFGMDAARLGVAGDSAGGNLAAYIAQEGALGRLPKPAFQLLLYPLVQFADIRGRALRFKESGGFISQNLFEYWRDAYVKNAADRMDVRVSPLFAGDEAFKGLPPAHIVLAGWDPLHEEGRIYAEKMQCFGVPVTLRDHPDMVHGFLNLTALSETARLAIADAGRRTGRALGAL